VGWERGGFLFHEGYWATEVGFYGGVNYGFGYFGSGFQGGRWDHDYFFYNRSVMNVNVVNIHNVYNTTIINNTTVVNRVSYNGGEGGIPTRPTPEEERVVRLRHIPPVVDQTRHIQAARSNPELRASRNQGKPPVAATARPGEFRGEGVVTAREAGGAYHPAPNQGHGQPANVGAAPHAGGGHASELQPHRAPTPRNTGEMPRSADSLSLPSSHCCWFRSSTRFLSSISSGSSGKGLSANGRPLKWSRQELILIPLAKLESSQNVFESKDSWLC